MEEELAQLNKEVKVAEQDENQPDKRMEEATKKLEAAERKQDQVYAEQRQVSSNLASLISYVQKMYRHLFKNTREQILVSETNVMMFLEKIEHKANLIQNLRRQLGTLQSDKPIETQQKTPKNQKQATFAFDNYLDDQEQYDKILTHQDFMKKANERFASKPKPNLQKRSSKK